MRLLEESGITCKNDKNDENIYDNCIYVEADDT